jgi:hypothetical protein
MLAFPQGLQGAIGKLLATPSRSSVRRSPRQKEGIQ